MADERSTPAPTSLMTLPPELRLQIYTTLLAELDTIRDDPTSRPRVPAVLHTSRLIRHESLPIIHGVFRKALQAATQDYEDRHQECETIKVHPAGRPNVYRVLAAYRALELNKRASRC